MIKIPYGYNELTFPEEPDHVIRSRIDELKSDRLGLEIVREAMEHPIGTKPLWELAAGKKTACIIISDHTRPVPSKDIIPLMLEQLRRNNPEIDITLLVATGFHRGTTAKELEDKLGKEIASTEKIVVHDAHDPKCNVQIGMLPSGAPLIIDRVAAKTELLVAEGFIEPHFFAGFSGGRKSVLPGICDAKTVMGNHCGAFIGSSCARTGILKGNPLHIDMLSAAATARLAYIVNVIIDENKKTVAAFAGHYEKAHLEGVAYLRKYCEVQAQPGDIVITSNGGAPLDQNTYQCVKGLTAAEASAKHDAVLIMCADLADGSGGEGFYQALKNCANPSEYYQKCIDTPQPDTIPDQWESQIMARILMKHKVIYVTRPEMRSLVEDMKMSYAETLEEALKIAREWKDNDAVVTVIPNGISVMVKAGD